MLIKKLFLGLKMKHSLNIIFTIGSTMHVDPAFTDAFNALIRGKKWWVALPKDLYEFKEDLDCLESCSDPPINYFHSIGVWYLHVLPQIRY